MKLSLAGACHDQQSKAISLSCRRLLRSQRTLPRTDSCVV